MGKIKNDLYELMLKSYNYSFLHDIDFWINIWTIIEELIRLVGLI